MQELQSCAGLVKNGALCGGNRGCLLEFNGASSASMDCEEQEEKKGNVSNVVAKISAELQLERQRNAELLARISLLESQLLQERERSCLAHQDGGLNAEERPFKKFKRQKTAPTRNDFEYVEVAENKDLVMEAKNRTLNNAVENPAQQNGLVNWMSMDDAPVLKFEKLRDRDFTAGWEESDDSEEDEDDGRGDEAEIDNSDRKIDHESQASDTLESNLHEVCIASEGSTQYLERSPWTQNEMTFTNPSQEINGVQNEDVLHPNARFVGLKKEHKKHKRKEVKNNKGCKMQLETLHLEKEISCKGSAGTSSNKKSLKVPFCPKEIKRMLQSEGLQLKNAQSHTIRKIIVFASLGIRHGCEDIYELDFNHFKILHKGEPYLSAKNPGEHVLYEYPGVRQKIFYPNRQNPTLCPVQILEEEKAMRPPDDSCPSYLFLCIKYGGRTRNLPQNEYVRQRMGRNKLKSFGPLLCRMAKLVRIRSGSFFFKALGITLLFMAGFSGDLVQRETKYRNLDLLQKYYRSDEEAEGEELFHSDSTLIDNASPNSKALTGSAKKLIGKRQAGSAAKTRNPPISSGSPSVPSTARPPSQPSQPSQFGLTGYPSLQSNALIGFHSSPPPSAAVSNVPNSISTPSLPYHIGHNTTLLHHAANAVVPMAYWPHPNAFPHFPYTVSYGYRSFPHSGNCVSFRPPQPYNYGYSSFTPRPVVDVAKKDLEDADSESHDGSSSSAAPKERVIH